MAAATAHPPSRSPTPPHDPFPELFEAPAELVMPALMLLRVPDRTTKDDPLLRKCHVWHTGPTDIESPLLPGTRLLSPLNGHPSYTGPVIHYMPEANGSERQPAQRALFLTTAPSGLPHIMPLLPEGIQHLLREQPLEQVSVHYSSIRIEETPGPIRVRLDWSNPLSTQSPITHAGIFPIQTATACSLLQEDPQSISFNTLHPISDDNTTHVRITDNQISPCGMWAVIRREDGSLAIYYISIATDPLPATMDHLQDYTHAIDRIEGQYHDFFHSLREDPTTIVSTLPEPIQQLIYWKLWDADGRPEGNPHYGEQAFQKAPERIMPFMQELCKHDSLVLRKIPKALAEQVVPEFPCKDNIFRIMLCALRILTTDPYQAQHRLPKSLSPEEEQRIRATLLEQPTFANSIADPAGTPATLFTQYAQTFRSEHTANALLYTAGRLPSRDDPALHIHNQLLFLMYDPEFQRSEPSNRATQVNALLEKALDEPTLNAFYGQVWERSRDPEKGGPNWGKDHVADDPGLLEDLLTEQFSVS